MDRDTVSTYLRERVLAVLLIERLHHQFRYSLFMPRYQPVTVVGTDSAVPAPSDPRLQQHHPGT